MKKYGLIGYPLGHSFSKNFFNEKFHSENIDAEYVNFEIPSIKELPSVLLANPDLVGLNVTIPYKEQVISYLDELDKDAAAIGAVNVIKIVRQKGKTKLIGYNSDVIGFTQSIDPLLEPQHKKALILGTGGAFPAIALSETVNDAIYTTYIYCYDGYLREITVSDGTTVLPGDGQKIIETNALAIDMVSSNLYCFTITDTTGYTYPLYISLNAKQS